MLRVLRDLRHDPVLVLAPAGLEVAAFDNPERRIPFSVAADLIRRGAALCGREDFGLLVGEQFGVDDLGLLGQLMWRARTVGEALQDLNRFLHVQDRGSVTTTLLQHVQVLEIITQVAMVALTPAQLEQLNFARAHGTLTFAVRNREDIEKSDLPSQTFQSLLGNLSPVPAPSISTVPQTPAAGSQRASSGSRRQEP